jgi:putative SOS response-associated peptidase YedK
MCGRYTNALIRSEIIRLCPITGPSAEAAPNLVPRSNLAPTQNASAGFKGAGQVPST